MRTVAERMFSLLVSLGWSADYSLGSGVTIDWACSDLLCFSLGLIVGDKTMQYILGM